MFLRSGERRRSQLRRRIRMARGAARVGATLGSGGKGGISPPAGGKVASRPSRAARRQHVSRRLGASAGQTGARGASAGGAGAGGSEARCHVRGRRGRGLDHAISRRPATQRGGGGLDHAAESATQPGENFQNHTGHVQQADEGVAVGTRLRRRPFVRGGFQRSACRAGRARRRGGGRHILHGRGVPETARSKTGSASSISHRQWRNRLNAGGESWEAGHGRQAGAHRHRLHRPSRINQCGTSKDICLGGRSTQLTMRRREFNCVPTVSPVGLGLGFLEKRCPPRPFNLAIRGNHFREFLGTRRPPPSPGWTVKSKRGVRFQSKGGLAVKIGIFGFYWLPQGVDIKDGTEGVFQIRP